MNGASDGARTRDLRRDRAKPYPFSLSNFLLLSFTIRLIFRPIALTLTFCKAPFSYRHFPLCGDMVVTRAGRVTRNFEGINAENYQANCGRRRTQGQPLHLWDDDIKGFGLLVLPSGVKSYLYRYRTPEGEDRRPTIGKHGALTPDKRAPRPRRCGRPSSAAAIRSRKSASAGKPRPSREVLDAYLASEAFIGKAATTRLTDRGRIERHLKPLLGRRPVDALTPGEDRAGLQRDPRRQDRRARKNGPPGAGPCPRRRRRGAQVRPPAAQRVCLGGARATDQTQSGGHDKTGSDGARDIILDDARSLWPAFPDTGPHGVAKGGSASLPPTPSASSR